MPWLRRDAYQERQALPNLVVDSGVWHHLPTVSIKGTVLPQRELKVNYTLSLANPVRQESSITHQYELTSSIVS